MERLGVLGGSFDPIHIGHLVVAEEVRQVRSLAKVLLVPNNHPPHKDVGNLAPARERWRMVQLAVADNPGLETSDIEISRPGKSYTYDTLSELTRRNPEAELHFIIGSDTVRELPSWYRAKDLPDLCRIIVAYRPGFDLQEIRVLDSLYPDDVVKQMIGGAVATTCIGVSATDIRARLARGLSVRYLLSAPVEAYIRQRGLYGVDPLR